MKEIGTSARRPYRTLNRIHRNSAGARNPSEIRRTMFFVWNGGNGLINCVNWEQASDGQNSAIAVFIR
jgi:hypothetical protein